MRICRSASPFHPNLWHRAVIERAKAVIVEVTPSLPYAHGDQNGVHVSEVDYIIDGGDSPLTSLPNPPPTEIDRQVARRQVGVKVGFGTDLLGPQQEEQSREVFQTRDVVGAPLLQEAGREAPLGAGDFT